MTPDDMANCAAGGRYWYMRANGTFYGVGDNDTNPGPADPADVYLQDASQEWCDQWASWDDAVAALAPNFALLNDFRS